MKTGEIIAINISPRRGTQKKEIPEVNLIKGFGLENDAHGGIGIDKSVCYLLKK